MARPLRIQYAGAVYHVMHRGYNNQEIFRDDDDRREFLTVLAQTIGTYGAILHSHAELDHEFHLLIETPFGNLSECLRHLNITYTTRFNHRHRRHGNLLHGRFKSVLIEKAANLSRLSRVIHLLPGRQPVAPEKTPVSRLNYFLGYVWSSLPGYLEPGSRQPFMEYQDVLRDFGGDNAYGREAYSKQILEDLAQGFSLPDKITDQSILGDEAFVAWVRNRYMPGAETMADRARGRVHRHQGRDEILGVIAEETGSSRADLLHRSGLVRALAMDMLYRFGGMKNPEIGDLMGIDFSTVSQARKRLRSKAAADQEVMGLMSRIEQRLLQ